MTIQRTFFSVGQALFCRERVDSRTIIYDCGGQTIRKVCNVIDREYPDKGNKATIDALFISHLMPRDLMPRGRSAASEINNGVILHIPN